MLLSSAGMDDDADGGVFHPYLAVVLGLIDDIDLLSSAPYLLAMA